MTASASSPEILLFVRCRGFNFDRALLSDCATFFASKAFGGKSPFAEVTVILQGDRASAEAHQMVMGDPSPTDVITLPYAATPFEPAHAELLVNPRQALRCALSRSFDTLLPEELNRPWSANAELLLYLAHGFDHLTGATDSDAESYQSMRRRELAWLDELCTLHGGQCPAVFSPKQ